MMPRDIDDQTGLSRDPDPEDTAALEHALGFDSRIEEDDDDRLGRSDGGARYPDHADDERWDEDDYIEDEWWEDDDDSDDDDIIDFGSSAEQTMDDIGPEDRWG